MADDLKNLSSSAAAEKAPFAERAKKIQRRALPAKSLEAVRRTVRSALLRTARFVLARPRLTRIARYPLEQFPLLKSFQRRTFNVLLAASNDVEPSSDSFFSEREQFVHARFRAALEKRAD